MRYAVVESGERGGRRRPSLLSAQEVSPGPLGLGNRDEVKDRRRNRSDAGNVREGTDCRRAAERAVIEVRFGPGLMLPGMVMREHGLRQTGVADLQRERRAGRGHEANRNQRA